MLSLESDHVLAPTCQEVIVVCTASVFSWFIDAESNSAEILSVSESPAPGAHGCRRQGCAGKPSGSFALHSPQFPTCLNYRDKEIKFKISDTVCPIGEGRH